ncbi:hypothetical protein [Streptomyces sp. G45]|uniref:hypothetical protein n=1 Tax=Streptomyces sp. G45 TaxID=3406627 RepID=UPI003C182E8F
MEWHRAALARAEARAPHIPLDERHRISEVIETERTWLREELTKTACAAETARSEAGQLHAETLEHLADKTDVAPALTLADRAGLGGCCRSSTSASPPSSAWANSPTTPLLSGS